MSYVQGFHLSLSQHIFYLSPVAAQLAVSTSHWNSENKETNVKQSFKYTVAHYLSLYLSEKVSWQFQHY